MTPHPSTETQIRGFLANYDPEIAARGRAVRGWLRALMPAAVEFVYDKRNNLVIGFGPNERPSDAILSIIVWPRWVTLCFLQGATLPDPDGLLQGSGNIVRSVRLADASDLETPALRALIDLALAHAEVPMPARGEGRVVIRQVSPTRSPRRRVALPTRRAAARPRR